MKYKEGSIVALLDGRTVYIMAVDKQEKKYKVFNTEDENDVFEISEKDILMKLT